MWKRRAGERRQAERRLSPRAGAERRRGDRRVATAAVALAFAFAADLRADVYTRKNERGVLEATNLPGNGSDFKLTYRSKGTLIHSRDFPRLRPRARSLYDGLIEEASAAHGVSTSLVRAIVQVESEFDAFAVSSAGAQGLMQLMPATAVRYGVTNPFDPRQNVFAGVRYLRFLLDLFGGDVTLASAAYNAGENAVLRYGRVPPYRETQGYVRKVQALLSAGPVTVSAPAAAKTAPVNQAASRAAEPAVPARSYTPGSFATAVAAKAPAGKVRVYYRWKDASGVVHLSQDPPSGIAFTTLRTAD